MYYYNLKETSYELCFIYTFNMDNRLIIYYNNYCYTNIVYVMPYYYYNLRKFVKFHFENQKTAKPQMITKY